jgi:hypothetical protein
MRREGVISDDDKSLTWVLPHTDGSITVCQGKNRVCPSPTELRRLTDAQPDPASSRSPAEARLMRFPITSEQPLGGRTLITAAVAWAGSMAVVLARQSEPPGCPALSLPSELGCRVELSLGSYT